MTRSHWIFRIDSNNTRWKGKFARGYITGIPTLSITTMRKDILGYIADKVGANEDQYNWDKDILYFAPDPKKSSKPIGMLVKMTYSIVENLNIYPPH